MTKKPENIRPERFMWQEGDIVIGEPVDPSEIKGDAKHWNRDAEWYEEPDSDAEEEDAEG